MEESESLNVKMLEAEMTCAVEVGFCSRCENSSGLIMEVSGEYTKALLCRHYADCKACGGSGFRPVDHDGYLSMRSCRMSGLERAVRLINGARIPSQYGMASLSDFSSPEMVNTLKPAGEWLRGNIRQGGLWIYGPTGIGKTHLSAAIVKSACSSGVRTVWMDAGHMLRLARESFDGGVVDPIVGAMKAELLVLDDIDKARMTDWGEEQMWILLKTRTEKNLGTVITANMKSGGWCANLKFGTPLHSRIKERFVPVALPPIDRRLVQCL